MSAHVSVFDIKRFAQAQLSNDELPGFEHHLSACDACALRLQWAATSELKARGLEHWLEPAPAKSAPVWAVLVALATSAALMVLGSPTLPKFDEVSYGVGPSQSAGVPPLSTLPADGGMLNGSLAFFDAGERR